MSTDRIMEVLVVLCSIALQHAQSCPVPSHLEVAASSLRRLKVPRTAPPRVERLSSALLRSQHWPRRTSLRETVRCRELGNGVTGQGPLCKQQEARKATGCGRRPAAAATGASLIVPPSSPIAKAVCSCSGSDRGLR